MGKFNSTMTRAAGRSPLATATTATGTTFEGHPGYGRDTKTELFLLGVSNFVGEKTFYESAADRDSRYAQLVRQATAEDFVWVALFLGWLRREANMRSASIVGAAEMVKACLDLGIKGSRKVVDSVIQRADEPGEMLAYWTSRYGRAIPNPLKRGVGDAILRLGTEFNYLKYDSDSRGWRFADVLNVCHPGEKRRSRQRFRAGWQRELFGYAVKRPYAPDTAVPESLGVLTRRAALMALSVDERREALDPLRLREAGMTWESLAGWLQSPMDAAAWEAIIPNMGVMALIRNLRNFDQAGVSPPVAEAICARITDPEVVANSRQLPYRWLSAYREVPSERWLVALATALELSVRNIPTMAGRSLVLIDTSASMSSLGFSARSKMTPVMAAALFGIACAYRQGVENVDVYGFADGVFRHELPAGGSTLREVERFSNRIGEVGHGTQIAQSLAHTYKGHDRVFVMTDEQAFSDWRHGTVSQQVPAQVPMYAFNIGGYEKGMQPGEPNRHQMGGLTDATFRMIPQIENGLAGRWPWEV